MSTPRRLFLAVSAALLMSGAVFTFATPAHAAVQPPPPGPAPQSSPNLGTVQITGWNIGKGVNGFKSDLSDQARLAGYPNAIQPSWPGQSEGFAGLINLKVISGPGTGSTFAAYCIDLFTNTTVGIKYNQGEWTEGNVTNVGFVAQLLQSYYPTNPAAPAGLDDNTKAAAVQAAIWYFSDGFVVDPASSFGKVVAGIVNDVLARGPLDTPPAPTVAIDGPDFGLANQIIGPFTVHTNGQTADGRVPAGVSAFGDAAGTQDLGSTFKVTDGQQIWLRGAQAGAISVTVTATVTQPGGVVYLSTPTPHSNQTVIQAGPATARADISKNVLLFDVGELTIVKNISGDGAGQQGAIQLDIVCSKPNGPIPPFVIPAGTPAGAVSTVVTGITVPAECNVTESNTGGNDRVIVHGAGIAGAQTLSQTAPVCPATQPLQASRAGLPNAPVTFDNIFDTTSTTEGSTTSSSEETTTTTASSSTSTGETTTTLATTTTFATTTTAGSTTTTAAGATTTAGGATTTAAGATTTAAGATTTAAVPTTSANECELSGSTSSTASGSGTLPATGSGVSPLGMIGLVAVLAGIGAIVVASRRRMV